MGNRGRFRRSATTDENREAQLVSLALDTAEEQMRNGTASSQVVTHFLKLGSTREKLEQERLRRENELLQAKVEAMDTGVRVEALYKEALHAMKAYNGQDVPDDPEEDFYVD